MCARKITYVDSTLLHLRRGQATNLEASLARSPTDFAEALCSVKRMLLSEGIYDDFENAFVSAAISHSFLSVNALKSRETRQALLTALREKYFKGNADLRLFSREKAHKSKPFSRENSNYSAYP